MKRSNLMKISLVMGVVSFGVYVIYTVIGGLLWSDYNPITTDISTLGAVGSPNQNILKPIIILYGVCFTFFLIGNLLNTIVLKKCRYHKAGALFIFIMGISSNIGYTLFPLSGDKTVMTFGNMMHIITTGLVVLFSIIGLFLIAIGYRRDEETRRFGNIILTGAILFTIFGALNPICINLLGLTERLAIFSLHLILGIIGLYELTPGKAPL